MKASLLLLLAVLLALIAVLFAMTGSSVDRGSASAVPHSSSGDEIPAELAVAREDEASGRTAVAPRESTGTEGKREDLARKISGFLDHASTPEEAPEPAPGSLYGIIIDPLKRDPPLGGGKLVLHFDAPPPGSPEATRTVGRVRRDRWADIMTSGEYDVSNLELGTWTASCRIGRCPEIQARIVLAEGSERVRHDFAFDANRVLRVTLHDTDGQPLIRNLSRDGSKISDLLGTFACASEPAIGENPISNRRPLPMRTVIVGKGDGDPWCEATIEVSQRELIWVGVVLGERTLVFRDVQPGALDVALVLSADAVRSAVGALEVTVLDDWSSLPQEHAVVSLSGTLEREHGKQSDASGRATFTGLVPGDMRIHVTATGYVSAQFEAAIVAEKTARIDARLEPEAKISGSAKDMSSNSQRRLYLRAVPAKGAESRKEDYCVGLVHADGTFTIEGLSHREYVILSEPAAMARTDWPEFTKDSLPDGMTFVDARAGSVTGVVVTVPTLKEPSVDTVGHREHVPK